MVVLFIDWGSNFYISELIVYTQDANMVSLGLGQKETVTGKNQYTVIFYSIEWTKNEKYKTQLWQVQTFGTLRTQYFVRPPWLANAFFSQLIVFQFLGFSPILPCKTTVPLPYSWGGLACTALERSTHRLFMFKPGDSEGHSKSFSLHFCCKVHLLLSFNFFFIDCEIFAYRICWYLVEPVPPSTCAMFPVPQASTKPQAWQIHPCA